MKPIGARAKAWWRTRTRLRPAQLTHVFRQLEMLLGAGILLADALGCLTQRFPDRRTRRVLGEIHGEVVGARCRLSAALARFPRSFPPSVVAVVASGEEAGSAALAQRFGDLADRIAYEAAHRREIRRACAYPGLAVALTVALMVFLLNVTLPRVEELLRSLGGELPPVTRAVVAAAAVARQAAVPVISTAAFAAAALLLLRRSPRPRRTIDGWFLRLPLVGTAYRELCVALFCKVYRSLYLSSQTAPEILEACAALSPNEAVRSSVHAARREIVHGGARLSAALDRTGLFPGIAVLAIQVGEQSGQLAEALERTSTYYQVRARERIATAIGLLNPALTLVAVGGAGLLLVAFFQALYQVAYVAR